MNDIINTIKPILKKNKILKAGLFGSYALNRENTVSEIDILVELSPDSTLFQFLELKQKLEDVLHKKVDLVEYRAIKDSLKENILNSEIRIYG